MILYYSGTGNSRYCAEFLAQCLHDDLLDLFHYLRSGISADLVSGKPWVFVCPTYAWQLPRICQDLLRSGSFQGSNQLYFIMTCGSDIGDAPQHNEALCREMGLTYMGTAEIVMPENYIAMFDAPESKEAAAIIQAAEPALSAAADHIAAGTPIPPHAHRFGDGLKSGFVNRCFYPLFVKAKLFIVSDSCVSCGKCAESCVTANIQMVNGKPVWGSSCTHCMACICGCPAGAIEYGKKSQGKPRYQCPHYIAK